MEYYNPITTAWVELQGYSNNALTLSVIKTGLTISTSHQVRYRARNLFGWSASYSDIETISTVTEPAMIDASTATVAIVGSNVQINWNVSVSNFDKCSWL